MDKKTQNDFQELADALEAGASSPYTFLKPGDNMIRLVLEQGRKPTEFFEFAENYYNGKPTKKWVVLGLVKIQEGAEASAEDFYTVKPIVLPTQVRTSIVNNAARGFELFDAEKGYGLTIVKSGSGLNTKYEVVMTVNPVPIDAGLVVWPEKNLKTLADEHTAFNKARSTNGPGGLPPAGAKEEESLGEPAKKTGW